LNYGAKIKIFIFIATKWSAFGGNYGAKIKIFIFIATKWSAFGGNYGAKIKIFIFIATKWSAFGGNYGALIFGCRGTCPAPEAKQVVRDPVELRDLG